MQVRFTTFQMLFAGIFQLVLLGNVVIVVESVAIALM